jgi:hypothetical protein
VLRIIGKGNKERLAPAVLILILSVGVFISSSAA